MFRRTGMWTIVAAAGLMIGCEHHAAEPDPRMTRDPVPAEDPAARDVPAGAEIDRDQRMRQPADPAGTPD